MFCLSLSATLFFLHTVYTFACLMDVCMYIYIYIHTLYMYGIYLYTYIHLISLGHQRRASQLWPTNLMLSWEAVGDAQLCTGEVDGGVCVAPAPISDAAEGHRPLCRYTYMCIVYITVYMYVYVYMCMFSAVNLHRQCLLCAYFSPV